MKKFKFKLETVLKLREFKEEEAKLKLGEVVREMEEENYKINNLKKELDELYKQKDQMMKNPSSARMLSFFPTYLKTKKEDILAHENIVYSLQKKYEKKRQELAEAMGEVKVMENMKEKDHQQYKKEATRKNGQDLEDILNMRYKKVKGYS